MKKHFRIGLMVLWMGVIPCLAQAAGAGSDNKKLGLGINLGEPLGANARFFFLDRFAADLTVGYGFGEQGFVIQPSLLFHLRRILDYNGSNFSIVPCFGAGLKTGVDLAGANDGDGIVAARFPIGAACFLKNGTFEISLEFAPGIEFSPQTKFDPTGGIGLRYYFF